MRSKPVLVAVTLGLLTWACATLAQAAVDR